MTRRFLDADRPHFVGIGGVGMSAIARAALARGATVSGSDLRASTITDALVYEGAAVAIGHAATHVATAEVVVYSTAVPVATNVELVEARARGIPIVHRAEALGELVASKPRSIGVMGTHGKGTTSAMLAAILDRAGRDPSFVIGAIVRGFGTNARWSHASDWVVAEVDESDGSLRHVAPETAVITNLELDHLNHYRDLGDIQATVAAALRTNARLANLVVNASCTGARELIDADTWTFGRVESGARVTADEIAAGPIGGSFRLRAAGLDARIVLAVPGAYNVENALAAATTALALGVELDAIVGALAEFRGLENRYTSIAVGAHRVIKDYVSHPTAIRHVLATAASEGLPVIAVFRPWRFTLVRHLLDEFGAAFAAASRVVLTEIDGGGEDSVLGIDAAAIARAITACSPAIDVTRVSTIADVRAALSDRVPPAARIVFFGGDDLFAIADLVARDLA